jgi:ABC-2 type transport system permease protein
MGFIDVAQIIAVFLPLLGITLGFDRIVKEKRNASLNVLLAQPIYRDSIIAGKVLGAMITLILVIFISMIASIGTMLLVSGIPIAAEDFTRIFLFALISYLYLSVFLMLGVFISTISKNTINSLSYGICIWLACCVVFGGFIMVISTMYTGQSILDMDNNEQVINVNAQLQKLTPVHYYSELVIGHPCMTWGGFSKSDPDRIQGIFDANYSIGQWFKESVTDLIILISMILILFTASFVSFLRQDIIN